MTSSNKHIIKQTFKRLHWFMFINTLESDKSWILNAFSPVRETALKCIGNPCPICGYSFMYSLL